MNIILGLILKLLGLFEAILFLECILSWIIQDNRNEVMNLLRSITNPILQPIRNIQYKYIGNSMLDLSPIFAFILIDIIRRIIYRLF